MSDDIKKRASGFIESQHIMTLATSEKESPWSAPVYYIYCDNNFYFFSNPASQHITGALLNNRVAASIHFQSIGWSDIRGVQMSGTISASGLEKQSASAFNRYLKKFDFIGEIKKTVIIKDIASIESAFKVKFYKFIPETIDYQDNTIKFGFKERILPG